jgi:hypothetical protein
VDTARGDNDGDDKQTGGSLHGRDPSPVEFPDEPPLPGTWVIVAARKEA